MLVFLRVLRKLSQPQKKRRLRDLLDALGNLCFGGDEKQGRGAVAETSRKDSTEEARAVSVHVHCEQHVRKM